ncbi:MAG: amidohydrolase [Ruminococcaceae bacterium]|nr:amidohydrolase [Oscillospiraceae bacterium]
MKIIDFHTHVYPDRLADKATRATCDFYGLDTDQTGSVETLLQKGQAAGIDRFVLLPVAVHPKGVRHVNEFIVEQVREHPEFCGFGTVHPDMEDMAKEIDYIRSSGLLGVKLHPDMQEINTDDERLFPLYECLRVLGMPLFVHCGDEHRDFSHPRRLRRVLDRFPGLTVIAAHLGGWSKWEEALACLQDTDCYLDISSCMMFMPPERVVAYVRAFGAHRVLFGTDFPIWDPVTEVRSLMALPLTDDEKEQVFYRNAGRIIGGDI